MLTTICDDTSNVCNMQHIIPKFEKDGIIQTSPVVAINRLKDLPTWLKVATNLKKKWKDNENYHLSQRGSCNQSQASKKIKWLYDMMSKWATLIKVIQGIII